MTPSPRTRPAVSPWLGFGMVVVGVYVLAFSAIHHRDYVRALKEGVATPTLGIRTSMAVAAILALVGLAMAIQLLLF